MKKKAILILIGLLAISLAANFIVFTARNGSRQINILSQSEERYVYIAAYIGSASMGADNQGMLDFAREYDVSVETVAPKEFDTVEQARLIDEVIATKPAGILVAAFDTSLTPYVNKAVDAGIPTITVVTDLPDSKRLAYVGTDWYDLGMRQADALAELIGEEGTVAMLGMVGASSTDSGFLGFSYGMSKYENIYVLEGLDDMGTVQEAERITKQIVQDYNIKGIAGFDTSSGIGIARAVKALGLQDKVKVTCVDMSDEHLRLLGEGTVQKLFGQKRELITYYGCKLLYDLNHNTMSITKEDKNNGVTNIPKKVNTGVVEIDAGNMSEFTQSSGRKP